MDRETKLGRQQESNRKLRLALIERLGGKCVVCGWDDYRALQVDHIGGGGRKEARSLGCKGGNRTYYLHIYNHPELKEHYQLLCANHNWIKIYMNKENARP